MTSTPRTLSLIDPASDLVPDSVASPLVGYSEHGARLSYLTRDGRWAHVYFDRWDAMKVSRGEYLPFESSNSADEWTGIDVVRPSEWLRERFNYESAHYGDSYSFNNDVEEMLEEFEHYLFSFHDEFVEIIAGGVFFVLSDRDGRPTSARPPWANLSDDAIVERWQYSGITCQIRLDTRPREEVVAASSFCDQAIVQLALELDGAPSVSHRLAVRTRDGKTVSRWRSQFGAAKAVFDGIPDVDALRPLVEQFACEVAARRSARKKPS